MAQGWPGVSGREPGDGPGFPRGCRDLGTLELVRNRGGMVLELVRNRCLPSGGRDPDRVFPSWMGDSDRGTRVLVGSSALCLVKWGSVSDKGFCVSQVRHKRGFQGMGTVP